MHILNINNNQIFHNPTSTKGGLQDPPPSCVIVWNNDRRRERIWKHEKFSWWCMLLAVLLLFFYQYHRHNSRQYACLAPAEENHVVSRRTKNERPYHSFLLRLQPATRGGWGASQSSWDHTGKDQKLMQSFFGCCLILLQFINILRTISAYFYIKGRSCISPMPTPYLLTLLSIITLTEIARHKSHEKWKLLGDGEIHVFSKLNNCCLIQPLPRKILSRFFRFN